MKNANHITILTLAQLRQDKSFSIVQLGRRQPSSKSKEEDSAGTQELLARKEVGESRGGLRTIKNFHIKPQNKVLHPKYYKHSPYTLAHKKCFIVTKKVH